METAIAEADTVAAAAAAAVAAASGQSHIHFPAAICAEIQNVLAGKRKREGGRKGLRHLRLCTEPCTRQYTILNAKLLV